MAAALIRMSANMLIITFLLSRTLTTLINETVFPCRVFAVIDPLDFRATVRAKRELVATKSQRVYGVVAIRASIGRLHCFFFDKAHDAGVRLDKICQKLKAIALTDDCLDCLKAHLVPDWLVWDFGS